MPGVARSPLRSSPLPPLSMARLRAAGRLVEIRAAELRFGPEETVRFLKTAVERPLAPPRVRTTGERVEGWIAGLKMVALAMRGAPESRAIASGGTGAGSPRFILEFLAEEVLEPHPARYPSHDRLLLHAAGSSRQGDCI